MAGFPTRPSANAIGPVMENRAGVRSEKWEVSARRMNLERWQLAGLGIVTCRAWASVTFTAPATVAVAAHGSAWQGAAPVVARTAQGIYTVTYSATYADEGGTQVPVELVAAIVSPKAQVPRLRGDWSITDGRIVTVQLFDKNDALQDGSVAVFAW